MNSKEQVFDIPIPIKIFCQKFSWPTESAMRAYRQRSKELCLSEAFLSVNRRVLVRPMTFFRLIESNNQQNKGGGRNEKASPEVSCADNKKVI